MLSPKVFLVSIPDKHDVLLVCSDHCCGLHDTKPKKVELTPEEIELLKFLAKDKMNRMTHFGKVKVDVSISDKKNYERIENLLLKLNGVL